MTRRRFAIAGGVLLALLGVYALVGYVILPRVVEGQVESLLAEELGVTADIGGLAFDPFLLRLEARALQSDGASFDGLVVDLDFAPLLGRGVVVHELRLTGAVVELRVDESGGMWIAGIALGDDESEAAAEEDPEPAADEEPSLSRLEIRSLALEEARFRLVDASRDPPVTTELGPIDLQVQDLLLTGLLGVASDAGDPAASKAELKIVLADDASLSSHGEIGVGPLHVDIEYTLESFPLASLQPWVETVASLDLRGGRLDSRGRVQLGESLEVGGSVAVAGLEIGEPDVEPALLAWDALEVEGIEVAGPAPWRIGVGEVVLAAPRVRIVQDARGSNLAAVFAEEGGEGEPAVDSAPPAEDPAAEPRIAVGPVRLEQGSVRFEDRTVAPPYRVELKDLQIALDRLANDGKPSKLDVSAAVDGYAPLEIHGSVTPFDFRETTDLAASAKGLELSSFSPYTGRYVGNEIEGGQGSAEVRVSIDRHEVVGENTVVLDQLNFGKRVQSPDATSLPVPAAAVLLADADGEIQVDLPVRGNLDDPSFSYTGTLLKTVRTLITRVVQTPFKIVGGMVSLGGRLFPPEELGQVDFAAGEVALPDAEAAKLDAIAEAMRADEKLEIEIFGGADPEADGDADHRVLARQRAAAVRERLEDAGLDGDRIETGEIELGSGRTRARLEVR